MELESDIVADSEGEDEYFPVRPIGSPAPTRKIQKPTLSDSIPVLGLHQGDTSHISEYTNKSLSHIESISVFTNKPQTSSHPDTEITPDPPKPQRPRPRPLYKMKQQAPSISDISGGDSSFAGSILSIADRAKMRSRAPKPAESGSVPSKSPVASVISLGVIDISSDDDSDELNSLPKGKPKARKGKEVSKPQKKIRNNAIESPEHSPPRPISPASKNPSSFLPNDDDINSHYDHPTIATLIEPNASSRGFSPLPSRQRQNVVEDDDVCDQLDSDMLPPAFFASSSLGLDKAADDHSHRDDISALSPHMPSTKDKPAKKGRKKDTRKNENEEDERKGKSRSKGKKTKETKAGAAAGKAKGKGKEKEVFKSSEFVNDDSFENTEPFSVLDEPSIMPDQMGLSSGPPMVVDDPVVRSKTGRKRKEATNDEAGGKPRETSKKKRRTEGVGKTDQSKAKAKMVVLSDHEHLSAPVGPHPNEEGMEVEVTEKQTTSKTGPAATDGEAEKEIIKENIRPNPSRVEAEKSATQYLDTPKAKNPTLTSRHSIAPRFKSTPMSELIRRVNSLPSSPFPVGPGRSIPGTAYSPYLKSNKAALSRIAPLHPNRRTPPPPLPPPPPPKKTKKEKEREEQWEEELIEEVGGMTEWVSMTDVERRDMRRMKREREMGGWED
ncbi:hypothetical protein F5146DRAFT_1032667 [Armillaria mellea]|nr:hypothetical protein F5146DRAFT_1032667 [Armillaria mellea]